MFPVELAMCPAELVATLMRVEGNLALIPSVYKIDGTCSLLIVRQELVSTLGMELGNLYHLNDSCNLTTGSM